MDEKYGFVYIWRDRKHKRYYLGSHWGSKEDGYICSSTWMKNSYKRRGDDFKRRVIATVKTNKADLLKEEERWLQMMGQEEIGKKYYNLKSSNISLTFLLNCDTMWYSNVKETHDEEVNYCDEPYGSIGSSFWSEHSKDWNMRIVEADGSRPD